MEYIFSLFFLVLPFSQYLPLTHTHTKEMLDAFKVKKKNTLVFRVATDLQQC